ncbi:MAG TPA: hypothetical protein VD862_03870 [Candidatus Paceibacterota bacterium]|nr:hypothetical protein [Candidatus Paceibacterota bacterium]
MDGYYPKSCAVLREAVAGRYPHAEALTDTIDGLVEPYLQACYILWMLRELQTFRGKRMAAKRGRWLGYAQARAEALGLITNAANRAATRQDVKFRQE